MRSNQIRSDQGRAGQGLIESRWLEDALGRECTGAAVSGTCHGTYSSRHRVASSHSCQCNVYHSLSELYDSVRV